LILGPGDVALAPGNVANEDGLLAPPNEAIVQSTPRDNLADVERGPGRDLLHKMIERLTL